MGSELALKIVKTVDDEGYYDRPAASEAVDRCVLAPVRECLQMLGHRTVAGQPCWCNNRHGVMWLRRPDDDHDPKCQRTREVWESLEIR